MDMLQVSLWRGAASGGYRTYEVPRQESQSVLDVVTYIQRSIDPTLSYRFACRVGMCGSCAMVIAGRERWACRTLLARLPRGTVTVRPLYHFPLIRDLVVDMAPFGRKMLAAGATFVPAGGPAVFAAVGRDTAERRRVDEAVECIGCGMCVSGCTMVAHDERFPGPAALNRVFTLQMDSRDAGHGDRSALLLSEDALARCHGQANCTEVCPMDISPTDSILRLRRRAILSLF